MRRVSFVFLSAVFSVVFLGLNLQSQKAQENPFKNLEINIGLQRPPQAAKDSDFALDYVKRHARTPDSQAMVLSALEFKCSVLWAMLDALHHAYVAPGHIPPGAFVPEDGR